MIYYCKNWHCWFLIGNWLLVPLVSIQVIERVFCIADSTCTSFALTSTESMVIRQIADQSTIELTVLAITTALLVIRVVSAMAVYMSSFNDNNQSDDSFYWLSDDEYNQQITARNYLHANLAGSVAQSLFVFVFHYLFVLLCANLLALLAYLAFFWSLCLLNIRSLRGDYTPPPLSTFEFACRQRIKFIVVVLILCLMSLTLAFASMLVGNQIPVCTNIIECVSALSQPEYDGLLSGLPQLLNYYWLNYPRLGYDWLIYVGHLLSLVLTIYLVIIFANFRASVFRFYKFLVLATLLALTALPVVELVLDKAFIRVAISMSCYLILLYIFLHMLKDLGRFTEADSIVYRKAVIQTMIEINSR